MDLSVDRKVPAAAKRRGSAVSDPVDFEPVVTFRDTNSVNCAFWNPTGTAVVAVTQSNYLHLFREPQLLAGGDR